MTLTLPGNETRRDIDFLDICLEKPKNLDLNRLLLSFGFSAIRFEYLSHPLKFLPGHTRNEFFKSKYHVCSNELLPRTYSFF